MCKISFLLPNLVAFSCYTVNIHLEKWVMRCDTKRAIWWNLYNKHKITGDTFECNFVDKNVFASITHYNDVIMSAMASQLISIVIIYSSVYLVADQRKHQSSASPAFVRGIHGWPVNPPHKGPVTRKMFPFDCVIMFFHWSLFLVGVIHWKSSLV